MIAPTVTEGSPYISGDVEVTQYSKHTYSIKNAEGGTWLLNSQGVEQNLHSTAITLTLNFGNKLGTFTLIYRRSGEDDVTLDIKIIAM